MFGLAKSTLWSGLSIKCRHTSDLSVLRFTAALFFLLKVQTVIDTTYLNSTVRLSKT